MGCIFSEQGLNDDDDDDDDDFQGIQVIYRATVVFDYHYHKLEEKRKELNKTIYDFLPSNLCCLTELIVSFIP